MRAHALILLSLALCATAQFQSLSSGFDFGGDDVAETKPVAKKPAAKAPAPAVEDAPADPPAPKKTPAKKAAAPAPAVDETVAAPAPAKVKEPVAAAAAGKADLSYTLTAKKATFDPAAKTLTLESVAPQVAAVKDNGADGKESKLGSTSALLGGPSFIKRGSWLGGASGLLMGKSGAVTRGLALDLSKPKWDASTSKATFDATLVEGAPTVAGGVTETAAKKGAKPTNKVTLSDVVLLVDATY